MIMKSSWIDVNDLNEALRPKHTPAKIKHEICLFKTIHVQHRDVDIQLYTTHIQ